MCYNKVVIFKVYAFLTLPETVKSGEKEMHQIRYIDKIIIIMKNKERKI